MRGSDYSEGFHDYTIVTGGIAIYPRLIAADHKPGFERKPVQSGLRSSMICSAAASTPAPVLCLWGPPVAANRRSPSSYAFPLPSAAKSPLIFTFDESL